MSGLCLKLLRDIALVTVLSVKQQTSNVLADEWDYNWDGRARQQELGSKRRLIFVRHVEYSPYGGGLSPRAKMEARAIGIRIREYMAAGFNISRVHSSTFAGCSETIKIIMNHLKGRGVPLPEVEYSEMSLNGYPYSHDPPEYSPLHPMHNSVKFVDGARIEAYFREIFYRPKPFHPERNVEVYVGHANVHRYLICRALQLPLAAYQRLQHAYGSITELEIDSDGTVQLVSSGESAHLCYEVLGLKRDACA